MSASVHTSWGFGKKISFRFICSLFSLYILPFPLTVIPWVSTLFGWYNDLWYALVSFYYNDVLGNALIFSTEPTGSGDGLYSWMHNLMIVLVSVLITIVWTVVDRKRPNYQTLQKWFILLVTYYLIFYMFSYGFAKVFYMQFRPPSLTRLFETFGQSSPMRLMWTFMGFSKTYTVFAGLSEVIGGLLLISRRTRTLGGLVIFGVMLNVFIMNMSYDIPVKLFSFQLMAMGLYLALLDAPRLINVFILNKPAEPITHEPFFSSQLWKRIFIGVQILVLGYFTYSTAVRTLELHDLYGDSRPLSPLYGVYNVDTFELNGELREPLITDARRWRRVFFESPERMTVMHMDSRIERFTIDIDTTAHTITYGQGNDTSPKQVLHYRRFTTNDLHFEGMIGGDSLKVATVYFDLKEFALLNRGFHWVNEVPYNRYNYEPRSH